MRRRWCAVPLLGLGFLLACRGEGHSPGDAGLALLVDSLRGPVERAVGLSFRSPPRSAMRTREQVRSYLLAKVDEELTPARVRGLETAYRLFGLLPDTLDLKSLLLELYTEQVAGYYEPDSSMLFGVEGAERSQLRLVLAHELVHALQGQYLPLDSILSETSNNDRLAAAQAVLEGQATLASLEVLAPGQAVAENPEFWEMYRAQVREQQAAMPVFRRAPLVLREALIFPYLAGAEFMHWWAGSSFADTLPYGPRMPASTEQVLHPDRLARGDGPVALVIAPDSGVYYEDVLGENELRVLAAELAGSDEVQTVLPMGWGGDRYRVYPGAEAPVLVWFVVWDDERSRARFMRGLAPGLRVTGRRGYRAVVDEVEVDDHPAVRYILAPSGWRGWDVLPQVGLAAP